MVSIYVCWLKYDLPQKSGLFGNKKVLNFCKKYTLNYLHKIYTLNVSTGMSSGN